MRGVKERAEAGGAPAGAFHRTVDDALVGVAYRPGQGLDRLYHERLLCPVEVKTGGDHGAYPAEVARRVGGGIPPPQPPGGRDTNRHGQQRHHDEPAEVDDGFAVAPGGCPAPGRLTR